MVAISLSAVLLVGCGGNGVWPRSVWKVRESWRAEEYFDDADVLALCRAIDRGDIAEMERLSEAEVCRRIRLLLEHGCRVLDEPMGRFGLDGSRRTPLMVAVTMGMQLDAVELLLQAGADPAVPMQFDEDRPGVPRTVAHLLVQKHDAVQHLPPEKQATYERIRTLLTARGVDWSAVAAEEAQWQAQGVPKAAGVQK